MRNSMNWTSHRASRRSRGLVAKRCRTARLISLWKSPSGTRTTPRKRTISPRFELGESMPPSFDWDNVEDIAIALTDKFPDTDPLTVRFTDMHKWITELPGFSGDPMKSSETKLEAIQMAWHEEFQDRQS